MRRGTRSRSSDQPIVPRNLRALMAVLKGGCGELLSFVSL